MVRELQEFLHLIAQHVIFILTLFQLMIFIAMGTLFRGKRHAITRYIAGGLQLIVINGIALYSALWGFIAFVATYALSFVWHFKSGRRVLEQEDAANESAQEVDGLDDNADVSVSEVLDGPEKY